MRHSHASGDSSTIAASRETYREAKVRIMKVFMSAMLPREGFPAKEEVAVKHNLGNIVRLHVLETGSHLEMCFL